jgi:hypothetical protein
LVDDPAHGGRAERCHRDVDQLLHGGLDHRPGLLKVIDS